MPLAAAQSRGRSEFYGHGVKSRVADQGGPPAGARPARTLGPRIWFNRAAEAGSSLAMRLYLCARREAQAVTDRPTNHSALPQAEGKITFSIENMR